MLEMSWAKVNQGNERSPLMAVTQQEHRQTSALPAIEAWTYDYAWVLKQNHSAMVDYLVGHDGFSRSKAQAMVGALSARVTMRAVKQDVVLGLDQAQADMLWDGALGYLVLRSLTPDQHYPPAPLIDRIFEHFLLYTHEADALGHAMKIGRIHHLPNDVPGHFEPGLTLNHTLEAMERLGLPRNPGWHVDPISAAPCVD
jgi:hypothetical protein